MGSMIDEKALEAAGAYMLENYGYDVNINDLRWVIEVYESSRQPAPEGDEVENLREILSGLPCSRNTHLGAGSCDKCSGLSSLEKLAAIQRPAPEADGVERLGDVVIQYLSESDRLMGEIKKQPFPIKPSPASITEYEHREARELYKSNPAALYGARPTLEAASKENTHSHYLAEPQVTKTADCFTYVKMRLTQIASGDYKACGLLAEQVAADALMEMDKHND
jgi:hypothetical protein